MSKLKFYFSVIAAKTAAKLLRLLHMNATNFPGQVGLVLCPNLLSYFKMPQTVIAVTGTNGKTTVSNMSADILRKNGFPDIVSNSYGGNVDTGIASVLLTNCRLDGSFNSNSAFFEVDERSAPHIFPFIKPDYIVCTNLQRDSMKRNAHTDFIFNILNSYIPEKSTLILNSDDLISSRLGSDKNKKVFFGLEKLPDEIPSDDSIICDIVNCPICGSALNFSLKHYNHIGRAVCPSCGFTNPKPNFDGVNVDRESHALTVLHDDSKEIYTLPADRITDIYNVLAAVTLTRTVGLSQSQVSSALNQTKIVKSRFDSFKIGSTDVIISLAKGQNPVACSGVCNFIRHENGQKAVIMILEDFYDAKRTSENLAWTYETDFEFLKGDDISQIVVGGKRCYDYLVRLLIAGIDKSKIFCCVNETDTVSLLKPQLFNKLIIIYDLFNVKSLDAIKSQLGSALERN
ncbi:MAG: MurT ligase domain-containing protein [Ruminococcus sp.]|nr:MurT ligase domain-containing protein [Ruminococcus sp.]